MKVFQLEMKRLMTARLTWILLGLALALSFLLAYLPVLYCYSNDTDEAGNDVSLTGLASVAYEKQRQADAAGTVTPERIRRAVEIYRACLTRYGVAESYNLPEGVYEREILPVAPLLHGVREAFADRETGMAPTLMEIDPAQIDHFDAVCEERLAALMAMEQRDHPAAQRKAVQMYRAVQKPLEVYPGMSSAVMDYQNILGFLVLVFCVVIAAPVFSGDYQSGADDILRCTKQGGVRLGAAKVSAALLLSGSAFLLCAAAYILTANTLFGWECTKTSVQMMYSIVTLADMNVGELQWFFAAAGLLSVLASVSFTLFLSSLCRRTVASLAAALVCCIAPVVVFMTMPGTLSAWLCTLLPASGTGIQTSILYALTDFDFLNLGGLSIWKPHAMVLACLIEIPLFAVLTVRSYSRHTAG